MKKIIMLLFMIILFVGCNPQKDKSVDKKDLIEIQNKMTDRVATNKDYKNFASCYIDEENKKVVVELIDNSKEKQKEFRKIIFDSEYLKFEQGGPYTPSNSNIDFILSKLEIYDTIKFNKYYTDENRTIYMAGNIEDLYIIDSKIKMSFKEYIKSSFQTLDDSLNSIKEGLNFEMMAKDGGTSIYSSKIKDMKLIICNTIEGNKDVYIGDSSMTFETSLCKN